MKKNIVGNKYNFAIEYGFDDVDRTTEIAMYVNGTNILAFSRDGKMFTTKWNLDEIVLWLRDFITVKDKSAFPVEVEGEYAAIKDINARDFDSEDDDEFDAYYDTLDNWNEKHRWHTEASGAIIADVYFQFVGDMVEISWNNEDSEEYVEFIEKLGGASVEAKTFIDVMDKFLCEYALEWF